jgi:hypothetical protein
MQVEFISPFLKISSNLTEEEKEFIKTHYEKTNGGFFNLYSYQMQKGNHEKMVDKLLKKGVGTYSARLGHSIQPGLVDLLN